MSRTLLTRTIDTPAGPMIAGSIFGEGNERLLCLLEFVDRPALTRSRDDLERPFNTAARPDDPVHPCPVLDAVQLELGQYFVGERKHFDLPLSTPGTEFQNRVWSELLHIPVGETISYGELANRVGSPGAQRAVGAANGRNRIAIIIPCHRVIESTGALRGYGGGLKRKQFLLDHERRMTGNAAGTLFATASNPF